MKDAIQWLANSYGYVVRRRKRDEVEKFLALKAARDFQLTEPHSLEASFLRHIEEHFLKSRAQIFQDLLAEFFCGTEGVFCEFGAADGVYLSNTWYLENEHKWRGVLAEPGRQWRDAIKANRPNAKIDERCVFSRSGETVEFLGSDDAQYGTIKAFSSGDTHASRRKDGDVYLVDTVSLNDLLTEHGLDGVDFLSIDTEGSEAEILSTFDLERFSPSVLAVEHNQSVSRGHVRERLSGAGYRQVFEEFSMFDDWFVRNDVLDVKERSVKD